MAATRFSRLNLVAVDSSEHSDRAFEWYVNNYHRDGDQVGIVHIHQLPSLPSLGLYAGGAVLSEGYQLMVNESIENSKSVGQKYKDICEAKSIHEIRTVSSIQFQQGKDIVSKAKVDHFCKENFTIVCVNFVLNGLWWSSEWRKIPHVMYIHTAQNSIGETICKIVKESNATTLIMGSRGLGQVRRTFLGSVSDYVIHHAHVPTIVVPPTKR